MKIYFFLFESWKQQGVKNYFFFSDLFKMTKLLRPLKL